MKLCETAVIMVLLEPFLDLICPPVRGKRRRVTPVYLISATRRGGAETYVLHYQYNHKVAKVNIRFSTFTILVVALPIFGCATHFKNQQGGRDKNLFDDRMSDVSEVMLPGVI